MSTKNCPFKSFSLLEQDDVLSGAQAHNMKQANPVAQDSAWQLLAQKSRADDQEEAAQATLRAFEKLRRHLSKLAGVAGYRALLLRYRALAMVEVSWLGTVDVQLDRALKGSAESGRKHDRDAAARGNGALLDQFLGLLVAFIGEALTPRLEHEVWPKARLDGSNVSEEERPA